MRAPPPPLAVCPLTRPQLVHTARPPSESAPPCATSSPPRPPRAAQLAREMATLPSAQQVEELQRRVRVLQALETSAPSDDYGAAPDADASVERLFREKARAPSSALLPG